MLLLVIGALLAFVPTFGRVELPAEAVLLLFLPPALLYWESLTTSLPEIRKNLRGIVLMGTLLVVVTAGVVRRSCTCGHALGAGLGARSGCPDRRHAVGCSRRCCPAGTSRSSARRAW